MEQPKAKLIIDSCCDLPSQAVNEAGVPFFRFPFTLNGVEYEDDLWQSMDPHEFYERLRKGEPASTAQLPYAVQYEAFERAAQEGVPTCYIAFTSGLSGSYDTTLRVADDIRAKYPDFELYTVDSRLACMPEGLLVYEAIRQWKRGMTAKQLEEWANEARWHVHTCFTIDELEHLRRGGRIPDMAAYAGTKLDIKPLLAFDLEGSLTLTGAARGRKKSLRALVKAYQENHTEEGANDTVLVYSADAQADADWVIKHLGRDPEALPVITGSVGPVIGSHVGPGMVAITFWGPDRREKASIADKIANRFK